MENPNLTPQDIVIYARQNEINKEIFGCHYGVFALRNAEPEAIPEIKFSIHELLNRLDRPFKKDGPLRITIHIPGDPIFSNEFHGDFHHLMDMLTDDWLFNPLPKLECVYRDFDSETPI